MLVDHGFLIILSLEHGIVQNWDAMEKVWRHTFDSQLCMVVGDEIRPTRIAVLSSSRQVHDPDHVRDRLGLIRQHSGHLFGVHLLQDIEDAKPADYVMQFHGLLEDYRKVFPMHVACICTCCHDNTCMHGHKPHIGPWGKCAYFEMHFF